MSAPAARPPTIGILGGMGPDASLELMRRVLERTPADDDCDHVHMILDSNPHVPSRIAALVEGNGESPEAELARMADRLVRADAQVLAIACNTAHAYIDAIRAAAPGAEVLDMIALAARAAASRPLTRRRVGMLASSAVQRIGLYERAFDAMDIECVFPVRQPRVLEIIRKVKRGDMTATDRSDLAAIARSLIDAGADLIVVACTEISYVADALPEELPTIDALDLLVDEIVRIGKAQHQGLGLAGQPIG